MFYINSYMLKINSAGDKRYNWAVDVGDMALCPGRPYVRRMPGFKKSYVSVAPKELCYCFFCMFNQWPVGSLVLCSKNIEILYDHAMGKKAYVSHFMLWPIKGLLYSLFFLKTFHFILLYF